MFLDVNVDVNNLAQQIGTAISQVNKAAQPILLHGWEVYVRQEFTQGLVAVIANGVVILAALVLGAYLPKLYKWANNYEYHYRDNEGAAFILPSTLAIVVMATFIITLVNISNGIMHMVNPEYYALQDIISQLRGK